MEDVYHGEAVTRNLYFRGNDHLQSAYRDRWIADLVWPEAVAAGKSSCTRVRLEIKGVTLHSYLYAWAERARKAGYPDRFAQEAPGHNSKAVHRAYAKKAEVRIDSLDAWEKKMNGKLVPLDFPQQPAVASPEFPQSKLGSGA